MRAGVILSCTQFTLKHIHLLTHLFKRIGVPPLNRRANAIYEGTYLLGTSIARPLIAKRQIEIAKEGECLKSPHTRA